MYTLYGYVQYLSLPVSQNHGCLKKMTKTGLTMQVLHQESFIRPEKVKERMHTCN